MSAKPIKYVSKAAKREAKAAAKPIRYSAKVPRQRTLLLDPKKLKPHPMLSRVSMLSDLVRRETEKGNKDGSKRADHKDKSADLSQSLAVIRESIRATGIREKLKVCKNSKGQWLIVDGRHRHAIAKELKLETVPCEEVKEEEAAEIIMAMATSRPMSKGALAYLALITHPEVATQEKRGGDQKRTHCAFETSEQLAARFGVSARTMDDAMWLFKIFETRDDAREKYEPSIWIGNGLSKIKAAVESFLKGDTQASDDDDEDEPVDNSPGAKAYNKIVDGVGYLKLAWKDWDEIKKDPERVKLACNLVRVVASAPAEIREAMMKHLKEAEES